MKSQVPGDGLRCYPSVDAALTRTRYSAPKSQRLTKPPRGLSTNARQYQTAVTIRQEGVTYTVPHAGQS
jgi:hypothetical protein